MSRLYTSQPSIPWKKSGPPHQGGGGDNITHHNHDKRGDKGRGDKPTAGSGSIGSGAGGGNMSSSSSGLPPSLPSKIWTPHPTHGFIPGTITDLGASTLTILATDPVSKKQTTIETSHFNVFPSEDNESTNYDDNCGLMYLNEATLLENLRLRWVKGQIYTYTANMLIALNPYTTIPQLYSPSTITQYQGKSLGTLPPHVFAIADKSYRDMKTTKSSQSIIVSGESGAGKTESTKYILKFLCGSWSSEAGVVERRVLDANPILESFGNAKTTRNNNSSRFGKFIEIHFDGEWRVAGGYISHYLLEKSRIPTQSKSERNYHIFYQLLSGLDASTKTSLGLSHPLDYYSYLSSGLTEFFGEKLRDPVVHDKNDFQTLQSSFANLDIKNTAEIYKIVALVLHIGNISFQEDQELTSKGGCAVVSNESLDHVVALAGLDKSELTNALTNRIMQTAKGGTKGTVIQVPLKKYEAVNARDALSKSIYNRLFDYIVRKINESIPFANTNKYYIGILDIAGFEYFTVNSFEQCMINFCNEKLQGFFNERVLRDEQELYEKEGLGVSKIEFIDNLDCIELIEGRPGLLSLLDEEGKLPKPGFQHFTATLHQTLGHHFRLELPRKSKIKEHREILDDSGFIIRHFAGAVCYETKSFLDKNNDALHFSLEILLQNCENKFLKEIFSEIEGYKGKLGFVSVAGKFKNQLGELLEDKLRPTGTSFVRCVKPNSKMVSGIWEGGLILSQLQAAGMTSVLELMQGGFPSRAQFAQLYATYSTLLPPKLSKLDPRFFCRALFKAVGLSEADFKFGLTRVFFRPGKFKEFDIIMRSDGDGLRKMVEKVGRWIIMSRWKRGIFTVLSGIKLKNKILYRRENLIKMQKTVKMHLARKRHRPRYLTSGKLRVLLGRIQECSISVGKLKKSGAGNVIGEVEKVQALILGNLKEIKSNPSLSPQKLMQLENVSISKTEELVKLVSRKIEEERNAEEMEKARKIQEEMEAAKRAKLEEEERKKEEELMKQRKHALELKRREEDLKMQQLEAQASQNMAAKKNLPQQNEEAQEQRDVEMALRLANMEGSTVEEGTMEQQLKRSDFVNRIKEKKFDLSGWKYSELRDAINTSCDVELLGACREEFHRRLKVYHAWKAKNSTKQAQQISTKDASIRAPTSLYQYQKSHAPTKVVEKEEDRYFRVPISKDGGGSKGLWYAHFFGEFIQRQMEVLGSTEGRCFKAGVDDMQMCELKLSETGLSRRRGAEILQHEFDREWSKWSK